MLVVFFALWVILNGRLTWEIAAFGAALSAALCFFCVKCLDYTFQKEWQAFRRIPGMLRYFCLLVREILASNRELLKIVYSRKIEVKPQLVTFRTPLRGRAQRCVLANSITLTPGTITVTNEDGLFTVHCLDERFAKGIDDLDFQKLLLGMSEDRGGDAK